MGSEQSIPLKKDEEKKNNDTEIFEILNVYPDTPDYRDYNYELSETEKQIQIKNDVDLRNSYDCCELFNSNHGCSIACSLSTIIYNELKKNGEELILPSINFIFYNSLLLEYNTNNFDNIKKLKISIRNSLKSLNKYGICSEEILPSEDLSCIPYKECYTYGRYFNFKYLRLENNIDKIKTVLNNNKFILCNLTVYTSFLKDKLNREGILDYPDEYDSILGMFSGVIVGYTEKKIIIKSCFGKEWGDKGYFNIDYKYLYDLCSDLWLIEVFIDKRKKFGLNINIDTDININNKPEKDNSIKKVTEMDDKTRKKYSMMKGAVF
jgi:hypothetical protein